MREEAKKVEALMATGKCLSALYEGRVWHRRFFPTGHSFNYSLFMCLIDLDKVEETFRGMWPLASCSDSWWGVAHFNESDHLKDVTLRPGKPLAERAREFVESECGVRPSGPILLLTHLSYCGYCFNPVSFYYCHSEDGRLESIIAEVSNTPWNEMHSYVLHPDSKGVDTTTHKPRTPFSHRYMFQKVFHVSPFMDMKHTYDFSFHSLLETDTLKVNNTMVKDSEKWFSANLSMRKRGFEWTSLVLLLVYWPFITMYIQVLIHWEAIQLWRKKVPFYSHPEGTQTWASVIIGSLMAPFFFLRTMLGGNEETTDNNSVNCDSMMCPGIANRVKRQNDT